jgi:hypothetical protein
MKHQERDPKQNPSNNPSKPQGQGQGQRPAQGGFGKEKEKQQNPWQKS